MDDKELLKLTPGELVDLGICPTCFNRKHNGALYGDNSDKLIYEDKDIECFFVGNPRNFPSKEELMIINNTYWQRHDFYNIMYSYLFVQDIKVDKYATEYNNFKKLEKVCPEWFQNDIIFLQNTFKDLDEIIQSNKLEERLIQLCECENHIFPVWLQGPMWPIIDGKPAKFIGQSKLLDELKWNDIEICYYFRDLNDREIIVKQST